MADEQGGGGESTPSVRVLIVDQPDLEARFDAALVERVLHNLVGNAARYCSAGGRIQIRGEAWNDPGSVAITVTNNGPHIPETLRATCSVSTSAAVVASEAWVCTSAGSWQRRTVGGSITKRHLWARAS